MKQVTKSPFSSPIYLGGKPIASESTKPNDLSSFFLIIVFSLLCTTTVLCIKEDIRVQFKLFPTNMIDTALHTIS